MTIQIAIVDDEIIYSNLLRKILEKIALEEHLAIQITTYQDGADFLEVIRGVPDKYAIVFMDILMPRLNGVDTAVQLRRLNKEVFLIFLTSCDEYMPEAFSCHAFDYILKPYQLPKIQKTMHDVMELFPGAKDYLNLPLDGVYTPVRMWDIIVITSDGHYLDFQFKKGQTGRSRMTASAFLDLVGEKSPFLTINRGIIINMESVTRFDRSSVTLENGQSYPIAVKNSLQITQTLHQYNFSKLRNSQ